MKIEKLKINGYGKLKNVEIEFANGINIVYGKNEQGKSTLLNYIVNSLYGISKNKNKKEMSDYNKFTPWSNNEFSGTLEYKLDNKEKYKIYRDFKTRNTKIYNENMEDISKNFNISKTKGNEFFYEQTNIDEELFKSTFLVEQQEVKLENENQQILVQKISNIVGTGKDNVSYKNAINKLKKKQLNEIGTKNSKERPINILSKNIQELNNEIEQLSDYENLKYEIEEKANLLQDEIKNLEQQYENTKEIFYEKKKIDEKYILENEKIKIQEKVAIENEHRQRKLELLEEKLENKENKILQENRKIKYKIKSLNKKIIVIMLIIILANILQLYFIKNKIINYAILTSIPIALSLYVLFRYKLKSKIDNKRIKEIKKERARIDNENTLLKESNQKIKNEIKKAKEKNNLQKNIENEKLKIKYKNINIEKFIKNQITEEDVVNIQDNINNKKLKIHQYNLDKEDIEPKLDNLANLKELLENYKEQYKSLELKAKTIECAIKMLTEAYNKMKKEVTPTLTQNLSENIKIITKGKYKKAIYNEENGLMVETENGELIYAHQLSIGTIDQLYLSLRLSMIKEISNETLPIILDESFAYFDNERLKNILNYLSNSLNNRQIIIFTCTNREKEILEKENKEFKFIQMEESTI